MDRLDELDLAAAASRRMGLGRLIASGLVTIGLVIFLDFRIALGWLACSASLELTVQLLARALPRSRRKASLRGAYLTTCFANNLLWIALGSFIWILPIPGVRFLALITWASLVMNATSLSFQSPIVFGMLFCPAGAALLIVPALFPCEHPQAELVLAGLLIFLGFAGLSGRRNILAAEEVRRTNLALQSALAAAEAANHAKSNFLAIMSHEIRTPLNGVIGMAQAMHQAPLIAEQRERLDVIRHSGEVLLELLNDLLDLSRIEAGRLELEDGAILPTRLAEDAQTTFTALARGKPVRFETDLSRARAPAYRGDPTRVRQIVSNLVSNAVKFTPQGCIRLTVEEEAGRLCIRIADTGVGIAGDVLPRVFDRFVQADVSTTRRHGGSGLGLAICRELAQLMGGDMAVESRLGEGSTFTLWLPLSPKEAGGDEANVTHEAEPASDASGRMRVLAAEDNPVNQRVLAALLSALDCDLTLVSDGVQAIEACAAACFDIILMDVQMPVMDGLQATRTLRIREAGLGRRTPIVALTADAMSHQLDTYRAAGMDGFVAKPIQLPALISEMQRVLAFEGREAPRPPPS